MRTIIIAEIGVNHNGSKKLAFKLIDAAKESGADIAKFQTAVPQNVMLKSAKKAKYQMNSTKDTESQIKMANKIHLKLSDFYDIKKYCSKKKIKFLSSPFDNDSLNLLIKLKLDTYKIPSGEITNLPFLKRISSLRKKIIISTGMAKEIEIAKALKIITKHGTKKKNITLLQCNTAYPTPFNDANLSLIKKYKKKFKIDVGYSDHTTGIEIPIAATALGAKIIEKHFTLNKNLIGPDHKASLNPKEFKNMVKSIRNIEKSLKEVKKPTASERPNVLIARKSIVTIKKIKKGERFTKRNIAIKRPGSGLSPYMWDKILGKRSLKDYESDQLL